MEYFFLIHGILLLIAYLLIDLSRYADHSILYSAWTFTVSGIRKQSENSPRSRVLRVVNEEVVQYEASPTNVAPEERGTSVIATALDLAIAYLDMGDSEGAKLILTEAKILEMKQAENQNLSYSDKTKNQK